MKRVGTFLLGRPHLSLPRAAVAAALALGSLAAACSAQSERSSFSSSGTSLGAGGNAGTGPTSTGSTGNRSTADGTSTGNGNGGGITIISGAGTGAGTTSTGTGASKSCVVTDPDVDMDKDGWTPNQGDCNDCDPNVNPGAVDVSGDPNKVDSDCSGTYDPPVPCDTGLSLDDNAATSGARSIELCQTTVANPATLKQKTWGVLSSQYVRADGTAYSPDVQVGLQPGFGSNVHVQAGKAMLAMSSGHARTPTQDNPCGSSSCSDEGRGTAPTGFPQNTSSCPPDSKIYDDVALQLQIRVPTNATGFSFNFKFYSMEYPFWVCNSFNDQFVALVSPAPAGSLNGNISFDSMKNPVSVNLGFFNVCDPSDESDYAGACVFGNCPSAPNPYCPSGIAELAGTGFDVWDDETNSGNAGATSWLTSQAPVTGGSDITITFAIWDTGDTNYDSTVLIDNFQWIATPGTNVTVGTTMTPTPQ